MCIVNTHLTPHDHLLADRIMDYNTILTNHSFTFSDTSKILYHEYVYILNKFILYGTGNRRQTDYIIKIVLDI